MIKEVDKTEEVKKVLSQYRRVMSMIRDMELKIEYIDKCMTSAKSGKITGMPRGGTPITMEDMVAKKDEYICRKKRYEVIANQKKEIVQSYIDTVFSPRHNEVLTLYYAEAKTIEEIAKEIPCTVRHALRLRKEGVLMVDTTLNL